MIRMERRNRVKGITVIVLLVFALQFVLGSMNTAYATLYQRPKPEQTGEIVSSERLEEEYYRIETPMDEENTIYVQGKTKVKTARFCVRLRKHVKPGEQTVYPITAFVTPDAQGRFHIKIDTTKGNTQVPEVIGGQGTVVQADESWGTQPGYKAVENIAPGMYHLTIARATNAQDADVSKGVDWWEGPLGGGEGYAYKEALLSVKSGESNNLKLVKYGEAIANNEKTRDLYEKKSYTADSYPGSYVRYEDPYMKDIAFVFKNPKTGKDEPMNATRVSYMKKVADQVTADAADDYDKLLQIYEYVAGNIYYDQYAYETGKNQYGNPYRNIYNLRNNKSSENSAADSSTKRAKVATTCQGYAAMVIALARAADIPARMVYGHHLNMPVAIWADEKDSVVSQRDHWWAEAYVDGNWIIIDANAGTSSKWNRSSFSAKGTWVDRGVTTYAAFDPSKEQLSNSYSYNGIYKGSNAGKFINRTAEISQLKTFLNTKSSGITNGKRLNTKYSASNYATWGTGAATSFQTDGFGRVYRISWGGEKLAGRMNLSNFSKLKYLTVYSNNLTGLTLSGCSSLTYLSANYNKLTTFDGTGAPKLETISLKGNKLTSAKIKHGSKTVTIQRYNSKGNFAITYDKSKSKRLTIYANPSAVKGYQYLGIYNSAGKRISSKSTYAFNPSGSKYTIRYKKK